jgi:hypothetical protein
MAEVTRCVGKQVMNIFFTLSVCGESLHKGIPENPRINKGARVPLVAKTIIAVPHTSSHTNNAYANPYRLAS